MLGSGCVTVEFVYKSSVSGGRTARPFQLSILPVPSSMWGICLPHPDKTETGQGICVAESTDNCFKE